MNVDHLPIEYLNLLSGKTVHHYDNPDGLFSAWQYGAFSIDNFLMDHDGDFTI
jgi:hypothetical protein